MDIPIQAERDIPNPPFPDAAILIDSGLCLYTARMEQSKRTLPILILALLCASCATPRRIPQSLSYFFQEPAAGAEPAMAEKVSERMAFWTEQKKGANLLLSRYRPDYFERARDAGIEFLRFGPDLLDADEKDFLIGDLDDFKRLNENDLKVLRRIMDSQKVGGLRARKDSRLRRPRDRQEA